MWGIGWVATVWLGCASGTSVDIEPEDLEEIDPAKATQQTVEGTWRVELDDERKRRFAIIGAALSSEPLRTQGLGKLERDEKDLYETWSRKKGRDVRKMEKKLRMTRAHYVVAEGRVTVQVETDGLRESFGPVDYEVLETGSERTVFRFDPGMGNGYETHTVLWQGPDKGTDRVTANGLQLIELPLVREAKPTPTSTD
ncbi:MAG: hypothetical protein AAGA48_07760 [Myxococcota bacterium]